MNSEGMLNPFDVVDCMIEDVRERREKVTKVYNEIRRDYLLGCFKSELPEYYPQAENYDPAPDMRTLERKIKIIEGLMREEKALLDFRNEIDEDPDLRSKLEGFVQEFPGDL